MRWKKVGECGNFAKLKTLQMVGERIIKPSPRAVKILTKHPSWNVERPTKEVACENFSFCLIYNNVYSLLFSGWNLIFTYLVEAMCQCETFGKNSIGNVHSYCYCLHQLEKSLIKKSQELNKMLTFSVVVVVGSSAVLS